MPETEHFPYLDHIAIASDDLERSVDFFEALGFQFDSEREIVEREQVQVAFAPVDKRARIEILTPTRPGAGAIGKFLEKKGPGLHHLCFRVENLVELEKELRKKGISFLYDCPKTGAGGHLVNFMHPKSTGGVLVELSQRATEQQEEDV